ncbi:MAG: FapA family protein, partial [Oscillospiraceae bacterium]|nr:FapA family protein [Oscillospiraceae bacterium]
NVYEILTLRGVDNSTGNIRFMGDVVVRGDVASGFTVKSEGSITIKGSVEGSTLEAGDAISVSAGIFGTEKSSVQAGGDIKCAFIQNSKVISSGNIYADSILFSDVRCGGSLILSGKNGVLAGGRARVAGGVEAKTIGSRGYAATEISIMPDANEKPPEIIKLEELIKELQEEEEEIIEMLAGKNSATGAPKAGAVNTGELIAATQRCGECIKQRGLAEKHLKKLYSRHETALREKCAVHCGEAIYPNTKIRIRGKTLIIDDELPSCIVRLADDGIGIEA